ncbi:MAG: GldG family protein [Deltaproteobacteria bacterium]|nr:GldG family protein [Deltaproteobacteria bacterium]
MSDAEATPEKPAPEAPAADKAPPAWLDRLMNGPIWVLLVVALFALANYTAARHYRRWDWTSAQRFTLSTRSVEIARSLREPVELYVLLSSRDPLYSETHELAERYAAISPKVHLHLIDPDRQRERLIALAQELDPHLLDRTAEGRTLATAGILVRRGNRHWEVEREQLHELGPQQQGEEGNDASRLLNAKITVERRMSEALLQVDRERATTLCFSAGHAEMPLASGDRAAAGLADDLRHLNFVVRETEVRGQSGVPSDCDALVIAGPQRAWPREDSDAVVRYLRAGGNVAMFLDPVVLEGRVVPTGLEDVAAWRASGCPPRWWSRPTATTCSPTLPRCTSAPTPGTNTRSPATSAAPRCSSAWRAPSCAPKAPRGRPRCCSPARRRGARRPSPSCSAPSCRPRVPTTCRAR